MSIEELSLSEKVCYSTLRIEAIVPPSLLMTGTSFLFNFQVDEQTYIPCLITNRHVIEGSFETKIVVSCTQSDGSLTHERIQIQTSYWIHHPDSNIDLCFLPIQRYFNILISQGKTPFIVPLDESLIPTQANLNELSAIEEIIMVGYPDGIWDSFNNLPIIRRGITATNPKKDFNGKQEFLIDAACFPGSSGSPVMILNQGGYVDKRGNLNWGKNRVVLLGVLYAGPQHTAEGQIAFNAIPRTITGIPNNLGLVIKSSRMKELKKCLLELWQKQNDTKSAK